MADPDIVILGAGPPGCRSAANWPGAASLFACFETGPNTRGVCGVACPCSMKLVSPWKANWLPGGRGNEFSAHAEVSRTE